MRSLRILLLLVLFPGCAAMDDYYYPDNLGYEEEYYAPAVTGCPNAAPMAQPATVPAYSPAPVQPAGYQTREPPTQ